MMSKPVLIWSCAFVGSGNNSTEDPNKCIAIWKERKKLLERCGVDLKLMVAKSELRRPGVFPVIDYFQTEDPGLLLEGRERRESGRVRIYDQRLMWPRDNFQVLGGCAYAANIDYDHTRGVLESLCLQIPLVLSRIGEGGMSVRADGVCVFSDVDKITRDDVEMVRKKDCRFIECLSLLNVAMKRVAEIDCSEE